MIQNLRKDYIDYLKNVLGISRLFRNSEDLSFQNHLNFAEKRSVFYSNQTYERKNHKMAFINIITDQSQSLFEPQNNELFEKVRASIQWDGQNSFAVDSLLESVEENKEFLRQEQYEFDKIAFFVSDESCDFNKELNKICPSPYLMTQKPEFKKMAWDILKLMKRDYK
ncbi:MAG TPA: hypothetical protein PLJ21_10850 [Pseudobdellovibrionaceae bacterium]|nr:hypothetical protein [Pseudobdellovibrionaceae bacterium]